MGHERDISGGQYALTQEEFKVRSTKGETAWNFCDVQPPRGCYLQEDDFIQIGACGRISGTSLFVNYRILRPDNTILQGRERVAVSNGSTLAYTTVLLAEGFLLSLTLTPQQAVTANVAVYVSAGIQHVGTGPTQFFEMLCSGYTYLNRPVSWPQMPLESSVVGPGSLRVITGTNPGAGAEITETVPTGARWQLLSMRASLVAAAAVANRQVQLIFDDGANVYFASTPGAVQTATLTENYTFSEFGYAPALILSEQQIHFPLGINLGNGHRIRTLTTNIQGADDWGAPIYLVREWYEQ